MAVSYGLFINSLISFLIVAFAVFMIVRRFNRLKRQAEKEEVAAAPEAVPRDRAEAIHRNRSPQARPRRRDPRARDRATPLPRKRRTAIRSKDRRTIQRDWVFA